ncbi:TPA: hypothetical protein ACHV3S_005225 [Klebsiella pneumoniae]
MDVQPNVQTDTVIKAFLRSELQLIRSQKKLLSVLPRDLASDYRYIPENLLERFFHPATDARLNRIALSEARPGSLLVPRVNGKPVLWGELIKLILDDSQLLKFETYGRPFDSTEMKPNEPCELLSGKHYVYKPVDLELFRKNIVSIQMNFLVNLWNLARFKPAYVRAYLALSNDAFQMLLDTEISAFVEVTNVVLFPRFITYDAGRRDHKV